MRHITSALFGASILGLACAPAAFAADVAAPAPIYTKAPIAVMPNWGGFYVGGDIGARWSRSEWTSTFFPPAVMPSAVDNPAKLDKTSLRFGGYLGYNWMVAPAWLLGIEADIGSGGGTVTHTPWPGASAVGLVGNGAGHDFVNAQLGWDGSVRARVGYVMSPTWLVYATGGVAWQRITTSGSCDGAAASLCNPPGFSESATATKTGWTLGGGVETMLWSNWIGRAEYRYSDFGHVSNSLPAAAGIGFNASIGVRSSIAMLGLAYKFGN